MECKHKRAMDWGGSSIGRCLPGPPKSWVRSPAPQKPAAVEHCNPGTREEAKGQKFIASERPVWDTETDGEEMRSDGRENLRSNGTVETGQKISTKCT